MTLVNEEDMKCTALEMAIEYAVQMHEGQKDRSGEPYILHPLRVMLEMQKQDYGLVAQIAAVLHDVVEDTDAELEDVARNFGNDVATVVDLLTQRDGEDYMVYIGRLSNSTLASAIKIADIKDNLLPSRSKGRPKKAIEKYKPALKKLGIDFMELTPGRMQIFQNSK